MAPPIKKAPRVSSNAIAFAELCFVLNDSEYSKTELASLVGINHGTVKLWLDYLRRKKKKMVYICEYRKNHQAGAYEAVYTWGFECEDVQRPKAKTNAEYSASYRLRKQQRILNGNTSR